MPVKILNPIDVHVGSRVRLQRNMLGLSQEKLGDAIGVTFQQVQKYENGTNRIGASRLQLIAQVLDVPISFFFAAEEVSSSTFARAERPGIVPTKEGMALNKAFMRIKSEKTRKAIVALANQLARDGDEMVTDLPGEQPSNGSHIH